MALGRGGDQVAVMQGGDTYEFFGGLSKGVEKRVVCKASWGPIKTAGGHNAGHQELCFKDRRENL